MPRPLVLPPAKDHALSPDDRTLLLGGPTAPFAFSTWRPARSAWPPNATTARSCAPRSAPTDHRRHGRRGPAGDRLELGGPWTARRSRPRRRCHRTRDQPRRRDALQRRPTARSRSGSSGDRRRGRPFDVRPPSDGDALNRFPYNRGARPRAPPRRRALWSPRPLDDAETLKERSRFRAVPNAPVPWHGRRCQAGGRSSSAATTASSPSSTRPRQRLQGNSATRC